jgi:flagellar biosynthesis protein FlhG
MESVQTRIVKQSGKAKKMHCLAISGGKGGVGKSNLAVNLSLELGALGNRVMLLDADFGLGNADLLCGVTPKFHLGHVLAGLVELGEIPISLAENVCLIPSGNGIEELANFSLSKHSYLFTKLQALEETTDYMLIDTAAGIAKNVLGVLVSAAEVIIVTTPEPTAIVDAYATIKAVLRHAPQKPISIVVNNVVGVGDAEQVFQQLSFTVRSFLNHKVEFLGMIPKDSEVQEAVCRQTPVTRYSPSCPASRAVRLIAQQLHNQAQKGKLSGAQSFWNSLATS